MNPKTILAVDDEPDILELVRFSLTREGFSVLCAADAEEALTLLDKQSPSLILLDLMLPGLDGFSLARRIKSKPALAGIPIIMLSARNSEVDVVCGLEMGAEDYITKPFSLKVLLSRVRAMLRRPDSTPPEDPRSMPKENVIQRQALIIDLDKHVVQAQGRPVPLTCTEFAILTLLASRPGWAFSRARIVDAVRGNSCAVADRSVDVQIVGLRRKLGVCGRYIETVRGVGYRFLGPSQKPTDRYRPEE